MPWAWSSLLIEQIWVLHTHTDMKFRTQLITQKRILLPLEPDFSNMSYPSVVIEPPDNNWRSDNRQTKQASLHGHISRRDQSRRKHKSKKRRRHRLSSTSSSSRSASSLSPKRQKIRKIQTFSQEKKKIYIFFFFFFFTI